jgi:hypothetical protein
MIAYLQFYADELRSINEMIEILGNKENRVLYNLDKNVEKNCRKLLCRKGDLINCLAKVYRGKETQNNLIESVAFYQKEWNKINDIFFEYLEKIIGHKSDYNYYYCVVDPFVCGVADWGGNEIMLGVNQTSYAFSKIAAYEITLSYIFNILNKQKKKLTDRQKWGISECLASTLLDQDEIKNKLWKKGGKLEKINRYPELDRLQRQINLQDIDKRGFKTVLNSISKNIENFM